MPTSLYPMFGIHSCGPASGANLGDALVGDVGKSDVAFEIRVFVGDEPKGKKD